MPPIKPIINAFQDSPPPNGFPKIRLSRVNGPRGPSGFVIMGVALACVVGGFYMVGVTTREYQMNFREHRDAKFAIIPYLIAEHDRNYAIYLNYQKSLELNALRHNKNWEAGKSVYSKNYSPPVYGTRIGVK